MSKPQSPEGSSEEDFDDDAAPHEAQWPSHNEELRRPSSGPGATSTNSPSQSAAPIQKRRRVTRACDECRRKKIKCDGKQPCTHCTVYSYECTYDQPSNRRRNPAPQYVEALEIKLHRAEAILRDVMPNIDLDDPTLDEITRMKHVDPFVKQEIQPGVRVEGRSWAEEGRARQGSFSEKESMLESMVEDTGSLDLDDEGYWDFHGHSSGRAFLRKMREQFGDLMGKPETYSTSFLKSRARSLPTNSPVSSVDSPMGSKTPNTNDLPSKHCSRLLCENALDDACAVLRFVHQPTFYAMFNRIYDVPSEDLGPPELKFLPLLYAVIALGTLFATAEQSQLMTNGFENAIEQGYHWYKTSRSMMDVTDCRDLTSLQTVLCMILFLQSSARLSHCYSHIGIALRSSIRMGLHRAVPNAFDPIEQETRKRVFWCIRKLDTYVGALLGLPKMLSDDDIDQEQPLEVDDEYITANGIQSMPPGRPSLMAAFNAHTRIVTILSKTVKYIYPIKSHKIGKNHSYIVSHARIREIEHDLQAWMESLPEPFRPGGEAPPEFLRIQHLLRMAYAHLEMLLYRPFLHYVSQDVQARSFDKRSYACAAACVSVSRNIIHLTGEMKRRGLLVGSYWFYMYTTFFAIISLVFYVLENPQSSTSADILKDAHEGKDTLAALASRSLAADRCSRHLADLFEQLPDRLKEARMNTGSQKKRPAPSQSLIVKSTPDTSSRTAITEQMPRRANTAPSQQGPWQRSSIAFPPPIPGIDTRYRRGSQDPYASISGGMTTPQSPQSAMYLNTPSGHGVPDLSAMMFPSPDPFAYPNQPMTTLENRYSIKQENTTGQNMFDSSTTTAGYENMNAHLYNGMAPFNMMPGQEPSGTFIPQDMSIPGADSSRNFMAPPNPGRRIQGTEYDQLFGEDWGGWMDQGYRQ